MLTGVVTGVLALYAHTIMPALRTTDDRTFVGAYQALDRAVYNPWFMGSFFGALILTGVSAATHLTAGPAFPLVAAAFLLYLGVVLITMIIHVPLNNAISAAGDPDRIPDLSQVRRNFHEARWVAWHLVRTILGVCAFVLLVVAGTLQSRGR
ncbi:DUF1772 domain-containing protein [Microlunatus sp. Gsoil 973]|nr:DUF1772 domain-containing protein [Microlunatus sp. Gsoil 973]